MIRFAFGPYKHVIGEVDVTRRRQVIRSSATGRVLGHDWRWTIKGTLLADGVAGIDTAVKLLSAAYDKDVSFCGMQDSSTSTPIDSFWIRSSDTVSGIKVMSGPTFVRGDGEQYVTACDYQIELAFEIAANPTAANIKDFSESLSFEGGGPSYLHLEPLYGLGVKVLAKQNTIYRVRQSGSATGWTSRPAPPGPIWPSALMRAPRIEKRNARSDNGSLVDWPIDWEYVFESVYPLNGSPNVAP